MLNFYNIPQKISVFFIRFKPVHLTGSRQPCNRQKMYAKIHFEYNPHSKLYISQVIDCTTDKKNECQIFSNTLINDISTYKKT